MSQSKLLAILGAGALVLGSFTMGGCPQSGGTTDGSAIADESTNSSVTGQSVDSQDASSLEEPPALEPSDNSNDVTDPGQNESGVVGDFDGDHLLTEADIRILARSFNSNLPGGDLNTDNRVDILDLALLLSLVR